MFISSADLMTRNLDRRMEVLCPVNDMEIAGRIKDMLFLLLKDTKKGRIMQPDGSYVRLELPDGCSDAQMIEYQRCHEDAVRQMPHKKMAFAQSIRRMIGEAFLWLGHRISPSA